MIFIRDEEDLLKVPAVYKGLIKGSLDRTIEAYDGYYNPEDDGYIILLDNLTDSVSKDFPHLNNETNCLLGAVYEYVAYIPECDLYEVLIMCNNEFGLVIFVPGEDIDPGLLEVFKKEVIC